MGCVVTKKKYNQLRRRVRTLENNDSIQRLTDRLDRLERTVATNNTRHEAAIDRLQSKVNTPPKIPFNEDEQILYNLISVWPTTKMRSCGNFDDFDEGYRHVLIIRDGLVENGYDLNRFLRTRLFGTFCPQVKGEVLRFVKTGGKSVDGGATFTRLEYDRLPNSH